MLRFTILLLTNVLLLLTAYTVSANEHIQVSGFGNVSLIKAGTEDFGYKYDLTKDAQYGGWAADTGSAFGLQLNAKVSQKVDFVVQGVFQDRIENDLDKTIAWAFLRYRATPNFTARVGRIATPLYMLSEYRDVGFAYLWTKPITDFYANIPIASIDGADLAYIYQIGGGLLETRVFGGKSNVTIETTSEPYDVTLSPVLGAKLSYSIDDWLFSGAAATTKVEEGNPSEGLTSTLQQDPTVSLLWPAIANIDEDFGFIDSRFQYYSLGAFYETGDWTLQAELSYTDAEWPFFPDLAAGYVSAGKSFNNVTAFSFLSRAKSVGDFYELDAPSLQALQIPAIAGLYNFTKASLDARVIDQESLGLGVRIDLNSQIALKGQVERTWLNDDNFGAWLTTDEGIFITPPRYIDTYSISLTFVF
ncbi:hypothetical protein [Enterovibrio calviensis]|uniref:hypothetical protein n=1 Tax=Enterovibrio calviensis TaxID=91359 RepID=UPI0004822B77|nr:hypothetical protein [Enterovibrio calviensis]